VGLIRNIKLKREILFGPGLACILLLVALIVWLRLDPIHEELLNPPPSPVIFDRNGKPLRFFLAPDDQWRFHVSLQEISPRLIEAVIAYEDRWFYFHPGVNPFSIGRALFQNLKTGEIVSGGSTLTMQVARMIERRPRTYRAKLIEMIRALELEFRYSKEEILNFYFNLAPYGGNIQGVSAASWLYFGKDSSRLGPAEVALLVAIPQSPETRRPDLKPKQAKKARDRVLARLLACGKINPQEYRRALQTPVPESRIQLPMIAPHLSEMLVSRVNAQGQIISTIDRDIQLLCEAKLKEHISGLEKRGIQNGAVVVIENKTRAVRALVGSPGFFDVPSQGQVNATTAIRSPGSTLKPFLYARALDQGMVSPELLLPDVPKNYKGYEPKNYDDTYRGMVSMRNALAHSLNVPAVNLEARLGYQGIWNVLRQAEFKSIVPDRNHYGLSIILGGCGVSLLELTNLYATLAREGTWKPYRLMESEPMAEGKNLFSREASYIISDILREVSRPDLDNDLIPATNLPLIAWKTGTSYGRKDAWSIGYDPEWTIGIWAGNATGEGNPELVGSISAAPLLFEIFDTLKAGKNQEWFQRPPKVGFRKVCALSGMIPGPNCTDTKQELFIYNVSPNHVCTFHQKYDIDDDTGYRLCSFCRLGRKYHQESFLLWPQEVANWMKANGIPLDEVPSHLPECPYQSGGHPPEIITPQNRDYFLIRQGTDITLQQIPFKAAVDNRIKNIYWFLDGKLLSKGPSAKTVFYLPATGKHQLTCMDEEGRKTKVIFTVKDLENLSRSIRPGTKELK
jgi:penicillin-binding protein 1C